MIKRLLGIILTGLIFFSISMNQGLKSKQMKYNFFIVSHGGAADPFWAVVKRGMEDAAKILSENPEFDVKAVYFGPAVASPTEVVKLLDMAAAAKPDGIAVTITDPYVIDEAVRRIIKAGIPVIAINVPDPRPEEEKIPYLFYIGGDEYQGGVQAAKTFIKIAKERGITIKKSVAAPQEIGHVGLESRADGFIKVMNENGIRADKLRLYGEDPTKSVEILRSYIRTHPETNVLFTLGPMGTLAAVTFLKEEGLTGKILHGTYDLDPFTLEAIKKKITLFTIVQQPYLQGYLPILYLTLYKRFLLRPLSDILTGPAIVDISNVEKIEELIKKGYW